MALNILLRMFNKLIIDGLSSHWELIYLLIHERSAHRFNSSNLVLTYLVILQSCLRLSELGPRYGLVLGE